MTKFTLYWIFEYCFIIMCDSAVKFRNLHIYSVYIYTSLHGAFFLQRSFKTEFLPKGKPLQNLTLKEPSKFCHREPFNYIGVGRGGPRGPAPPPYNLRGGGGNIPFGPPNNLPTCTGKTIPLNSILDFSIISYFKMRNVIIWH